MTQRFFGLLTAALCLFGTLATGPAAAQEAIPYYLVLSDGRVIYSGEDDNKQTLPNRSPDSVVQQGNLRFNVFYEDAAGNGFKSATEGALRKLRFEEALAYVAQVLNPPQANRTLDVLVSPSTAQNNGRLATAGTLFQGIDGYQNGTAFLRVSTGAKPAATRPEVIVEVNFAPNAPYNVSSGGPTNSQFDLQSVLVHEVLHAMGFLSLAEPDGTSPFEPNSVSYTVFDSFVRRDTGNRLLFPFDVNLGTPIFNGTVADLSSVDLGFTGPLAAAQFGSVPPLFAPNPYQDGSSVSHWETGSIPGGAVMEHAFSPGEVIRQVPAFEALAMKDLGWSGVNTANLNRLPSADFTADDTTVGVGQQVKFTDLSFSGSRHVTSWQWNFGDGTTSTQTNPTKAYNTPGTFNVSLTVQTALGSDAATQNGFITVSGTAPTAAFTALPTSGSAPLVVQFTDQSNGNGSAITSRQWNFGDGNSSTETNPQHTYEVAGTFNVSLTVSGANGSDVETKTGLIVVASGETPGGCACSGAKATEDGLPTGDTLVTAASVGLMIFLGLRRRK